jgi:hypothetical protein
MKNKYLKLFLLFVAIILWFWIIYTVYQSFYQDKAVKPLRTTIAKPEVLIYDSVILDLDYSDPFLKTNSMLNTTHYNNSRSQPFRSHTMPSNSEGDIHDENIQFKGIIQSGNKMVAIIAINGSDKLFNINDSVLSYKIIFIDKFMIKLQKNRVITQLFYQK